MVLSLAFFSGNSYGQFAPVWNTPYQHTNTSGFSNEGRKIAEDPSGNIFVLSDVTSDFDPNGVQGTTTYHYVTIIKYSSTGSPIDKMIIDVQGHVTSGYDNFSAFGLEIDASGSVYVGYSTFNVGTGFDIVLAKYTNDLTNIWTNTLAMNGTETGVEMKLHPGGMVYAIMKSTDLNDTYSLIKSVPSNNPPVIVYQYPAGLVRLNSLDLDGAQTAYVTGYSLKGGYKNVLVAAINITTNSVIWGSTYTNPRLLGDDAGNKITVGIDGNIYTTGYTDMGSSNGGKQTLVLKNLPGNSHFEFIVILKGSEANESGYFIHARESGWLYIGAASTTAVTVYRIPDDGVFTNPGSTVFNPSPLSTWYTINSVSLKDMKVSSSKNIYVTGGVNATGPSGVFNASYLYKAGVVFGNAVVKLDGLDVEGDINHNLEGVSLNLDYAKTDIYFLRNFWSNYHVNETVELLDVNVPYPLRKAAGNNSGLVSLSPNPARDRVYINADVNVSNIEIMNMTGSKVLSINLDSKQGSLDISSLPEGMYVCKIQTSAGIKVERLVIN